jgi:hypothetical protein
VGNPKRGASSWPRDLAAYDMRMDRYRADLTRINATWNAMDAAEMRHEAVANGEVQGNFGAPPPAPDSVVGSDDKSRLNAWCARYRDKAADYNLAKQIDVLEKCYEQDCELSLEGGNTNRPDRPGCRYVDGSGFCYAMGAGQIWCRDNAIRSPPSVFLVSVAVAVAVSVSVSVLVSCRVRACTSPWATF